MGPEYGEGVIGCQRVMNKKNKRSGCSPIEAACGRICSEWVLSTKYPESPTGECMG